MFVCSSHPYRENSVGGGEKQNKCKRGSRANKLQPKLLGGLGPPSESILGGDRNLHLYLSLNLKKKKKNHRCHCGTAASWSSSGSCRSRIGAARPSVRGTRRTMAPSFFQIGNRILALRGPTCLREPCHPPGSGL